MSISWFKTDGKSHFGPYTIEQLQEMVKSGELGPSDNFTNSDITPTVITFEEFKSQIFSETNPRTQETSPLSVQSEETQKDKGEKKKEPKQRTKKKKGCCLGCFTSVLAVSVAIVLIVFGITWWNSKLPSKNLVLGKNIEVASQNVPSSGGTIKINSAGSEINGMTIDVPDNAYSQNINFKISTSPITSHKFDDMFNPITPLISIDNGHKYADSPMTITIPISINPDEFAMGFYYDRKTGKLEGMPLISQNEKGIVIGASHFSDLLITKVLKNKLDDIKIRTGYSPGRDDWQFTNFGSIIAQGGHCAGQSMSSIWYYFEKGLVTGKRLFGKFDNNGSSLKTPNFQEDDSFGYRLASVIQKKSKWDSYSYKLFDRFGSLPDRMGYYAFAYAMAESNMPQLLTIWANENGVEKGHAIVAYRIEANRIYVADPNYYGKVDRYVSFNTVTGNFDPYSSGANATDISNGKVLAFTKFCYIPVSTVINWNLISKEYENLMIGEVGNDSFPDKMDVKWLTKYDDITGDETWDKCPDELMLDVSKTAAVNKIYTGKLLLELEGCANNQLTTIYKGTVPYKVNIAPNDKGNTIINSIELDKGVNDIGILITYKITNSAGNDVVYFSNFRRIKVIYDIFDLSGGWESKFIPSSGSLLSFAKEIIAQLVYQMKFYKSIDEARIGIDKDVTIEPGGYSQQNVVFKFEKSDASNPQIYNVTAEYVSDGKRYTISSPTELKKDGKFKMHFWDPEGKATIYCEGSMLDDTHLGGHFTLSLLGVFPNALEGDWIFTRKP